MKMQTIIRENGTATIDEQDEFISLVLSEDEVHEHTLRANVPLAHCLVFLRKPNMLVGVSALKIPQKSYRASIYEKSSVCIDCAKFPFELGYIVITSKERGKGYSQNLVKNTLDASEGRGVFATVRANNFIMHNVLENFGFNKSGKTYTARDRKNEIQLFLRP